MWCIACYASIQILWGILLIVIILLTILHCTDGASSPTSPPRDVDQCQSHRRILFKKSVMVLQNKHVDQAVQTWGPVYGVTPLSVTGSVTTCEGGCRGAPHPGELPRDTHGWTRLAQGHLQETDGQSAMLVRFHRVKRTIRVA